MNQQGIARFLSLASLLVVAGIASDATQAAPATAAAPAAENCAVVQPRPPSDASRQALQALASDSPQRISTLQQYLAQLQARNVGNLPAADLPATDKVAANRARLVVAASHLQNQRFDEARQLLAGIELDSPVAVQASLLLAESWRLQGDHQRAAQWMLRTGQRYGADPQALTSLLSHASELRQLGAAREAFALYNLVQNQILDNSKQVAALREEMDQLADRLLHTRLDESREAHSQLLKQIIHETDGNVIGNLRQLAANGRVLRCLARQQKQIAELAFDNSAQQVRIKPFLTMLEREQAMLERRLAQLATDPRPQVTSERNEIEQQLNAARAQHQKLLTEQQNLPDKANQQHRLLTGKIDTLNQENVRLRDAIRSQLKQHNEQLLGQYRELAAESQYGRASLLHEQQRGG